MPQAFLMEVMEWNEALDDHEAARRASTGRLEDERRAERTPSTRIATEIGAAS